MLLARKIMAGILFFLATGLLAYAAGSAIIGGTISNSAGNPVPGAQVTLTNTETKTVLTAITDADGRYRISGLNAGTYTLTVTKDGFKNFSESDVHLAENQVMSTPILLNVATVAQSVTVTAGGSAETAVTTATISQGEMEQVSGPTGSAAQALTAAPGIMVYGYGGVAPTARSEIEIRGIKGGWSSVNGDVLRNGISFLLDGIPMNGMIQNAGAWESTQLPIMNMISDTVVTYGPGAPSNRWFDSLGGTVNFVPVQPSTAPGAKFTAGASYGSYNTSIEHFIAQTGEHKGWSAVLASGYANNDTFRVGTTGIPTFTAPSSGYSAYFNVQRLFDNGSFNVAYYHSRNTEYRPNFVPLTPINNVQGDTITTQGLYGTDRLGTTPLPTGAQLYSQPTSGFYSSLAKALWYKQIKGQSDMVYSKLQLALSPLVTFNNSEWYRHAYRLHNRQTNFYGSQYTLSHEWYDPASNTVGSQSSFDIQAPHDLVTVGGYWMHGDYHNPVALYTAAQGTSRYNPAFFNSDYLYTDYGFLYIQDRVDMFNKKLIITPGLAEQMFRTAFYNTGLVDWPNSSPALDNELAPDSHKNFSEFSPSVGAQYLAANWLTFHANFGITYQNPSDDAFGANRPTVGVNLANLQPLKSTNVEGGFLVTKCPMAFLGRCSLDATYFHDQLSNETIITSTANSNVPSTIAFASSLVNGVSINFDESATRYLTVHGNGAIQHDYFLSYVPNGTTTNYGSYPISNTPKYMTNLGATTLMEANDHAWTVTPGLWWQYEGTRYLFSNVTTAPTKQTMPGYGVVNFNMDATLNGLGHVFHNAPPSISKIPIQMSLGVENLLNNEYNPTAYITSGGYFGTAFGGYTLVDPGAPREYIVSLNFGVK